MTDDAKDSLSIESQKPVSEISGESFDVVIVGAGPAGSIAARSLARDGFKVLMLDRERFPREKVCGDCLITDTIKCLKRTGLYDRVLSQCNALPSATIYSPSRHTFEVPGEYLIIERKRFDAILAEEAVKSGAQFACGTVSDIATNPDSTISVETDQTSSPINCRVCIVATGGQIHLARKLGAIKNSTPYAVAMRCYIRSDADFDKMVLTYDKSILPGYGWIIPMGDGRFNVGCGCFSGRGQKIRQDLKAVFNRLISEFPIGKKIMDQGEIISQLKGAPLRCNLLGAEPVNGSSILFTGETIGTTYPFTGEGIGKAMESGEIVAEVTADALNQDNMSLLRKYRERLDSEIKPSYEGYLAAEKLVKYPLLNDYLSKRLSRSDHLRRTFTSFASESGEARIGFALWTILQSYWK